MCVEHATANVRTEHVTADVCAEHVTTDVCVCVCITGHCRCACKRVTVDVCVEHVNAPTAVLLDKYSTRKSFQYYSRYSNWATTVRLSIPNIYLLKVQERL